MKIKIPFTKEYKRFHRIKKHLLKMNDNRRRLEADAREYLTHWQMGFYTPKALNILRKYYKNHY